MKIYINVNFHRNKPNQIFLQGGGGVKVGEEERNIGRATKNDINNSK